MKASLPKDAGCEAPPLQPDFGLTNLLRIASSTVDTVRYSRSLEVILCP
jgi:hypothetical protein